jgi:hypothetical protein
MEPEKCETSALNLENLAPSNQQERNDEPKTQHLQETYQSRTYTTHMTNTILCTYINVIHTVAHATGDIWQSRQNFPPDKNNRQHQQGKTKCRVTLKEQNIHVAVV